MGGGASRKCRGTHLTTDRVPLAELARLGALESELFLDNDKFRNRERLSPDPDAKRLFIEQVAKADDLANRALALAPGDADALLGESIALRLRADYASLVERKSWHRWSVRNDLVSIQSACFPPTCEDLRFALRPIRRSPGFAITTVLILAMWIAANVIVFGVLQALILQPWMCLVQTVS
jgi:hypothetical protein